MYTRRLQIAGMQKRAQLAFCCRPPACLTPSLCPKLSLLKTSKLDPIYMHKARPDMRNEKGETILNMSRRRGGGQETKSQSGKRSTQRVALAGPAKTNQNKLKCVPARKSWQSK